MPFNPHDVGVHNGNIFGFPVTEEDADIVIIPVPWDVTASYRKGTSKGPEAILEASVQLDFYHPELENAWKSKIFMASISEDWQKINADWNQKLAPYFTALEAGDDVGNYQEIIENENQVHQALTDNLYERCQSILEKGKIPAVLGGEHSCPLGLIRSVGEKHGSFGILQIDAHADLRDSYEGFSQSHASIMYNALKLSSVSKLVQVGIRDLSVNEKDIAENDERVASFYDWDIKSKIFEGQETWATTCEKIVETLPEIVYISFDIDALDPSLCPNTGTPVPGGFRFEEMRYLLQLLVKKERKIVGFDLCEVSPGKDDWDANVGARILWEICVSALRKK